MDVGSIAVEYLFHRGLSGIAFLTAFIACTYAVFSLDGWIRKLRRVSSGPASGAGQAPPSKPPGNFVTIDFANGLTFGPYPVAANVATRLLLDHEPSNRNAVTPGASRALSLPSSDFDSGELP